MRTVLEAIKDYKHICWYPSAANDFRPLLFLSDWYYKDNNVPRDEGQVLPDLFVMSDLTGLHSYWDDDDERKEYALIEKGKCPSDAFLIYKKRTVIKVKRFEKLQELTLTYDPALTSFEPTPYYNSACLMTVEVRSDRHGVTNVYETAVLYITAQNEAVARELFIPNGIKVEYQVIVIYGDAMGGALLKPAWIISSYKELGIKYLIANNRYIDEYDDNREPICTTSFEKIYSVESRLWYNRGDVGWYKLN